MLPCYIPRVPGELPARTEVAILGGGFAGCATAWALAAHGVSAVVLEGASALGAYASGRGAGLGRQLADDDATTALTVAGAAVLRGELAHTWRATGGILGFDDLVRAAAYTARAARFGVAAHAITRGDVLARWPSLDALPLAAALAVPGDGVIDVQALLATYASAAQVELATRVTAVEAGRVTTSRGSIAARVIVDATGAWAGQLVGAAPLETFKRHIFVVEAAASLDTPYLWHLGARELYVRRARDGVLVSPCDADITMPADQEPSPDADARLRSVLAPVASPLASARIVRRWACQRAFTPERTMRLGRDPSRPWLVWAAGLGGHGATASAAVGRVVAAAVIDALAS